MSKKKKKKAKKGCAGLLLFLILAAGLAALVYLMKNGKLSLPTLTFPSDTTTAEITEKPEITFPSLDETGAPTTTETTTHVSDPDGTEKPSSDTDAVTEAETTQSATDAPAVTADVTVTTPEETSSAVTTTPENTPPKIEVTWEPDGMSDSYELDGETVYFSTVNRPVFSGGPDKALEKINMTLKGFCEGFIRLTSEDKLLAEEAYENARFDYEPYERSGDCTVFVKENVLSVLFHLYRSTGGADSVNEYKAFTFDLSTGETVSFADYIGKDTVFGREYILSVFTQRIDHAPRDFFSDAKDTLGRLISLDNYYLTEDVLVLFFNPNTIAPAAHGVITVEVPYSEIKK